MKLKQSSHNNAAEVGLISPEAYSTAWLALVPDAQDPSKPAWPQAFQYLQTHQLIDGGWGEPQVYYAHERLISTLAALYALSTWGNPADNGRIKRGVQAVHQYVHDLPDEPNEPIGFELLLPALLSKLAPFQLDLPKPLWSDEFQEATAKKLKLIGSMAMNYDQPRTWWFSMEMLPEEQLAQISKQILDAHGSIATSTAATAAYLRALRLNGRDSAEATNFLNHVLHTSGGGVGFCWPIEVFELTWVLDAFMRAGFDPNSQHIAPFVEKLAHMYETHPTGLSWSQVFPLNDSDDTATGYSVLRWAGLRPREDTLLNFWNTTHFQTYLDERTASVSANINALSALRHNLHIAEHKQVAIHVTNWLREQLDTHGQFTDKWHLSPLYVTSRAIFALAGWDDDLTQRCIDYILQAQHASGGWGYGTQANLEETSFAVLGLIAAWHSGQLRDDGALRRARYFFANHSNNLPTERLWIGKTLYQPVGVTTGTIYAAKVALAKQEASRWMHSRNYRIADTYAFSTNLGNRNESLKFNL